MVARACFKSVVTIHASIYYKGETMNIIVAIFIAVAFVYGLYQLTIGDDDE